MRRGGSFIQICGWIALLGSVAAALIWGSSVKAQDESEAPKVLQSEVAPWRVEIQRPQQSIADLNFLDQQIPVYLVTQSGVTRALVRVVPIFKRAGWTLKVKDQTLVKAPKVQGGHIVHVYLSARTSELHFTAEGPGGESEQETVQLFAPETRQFKMKSFLDSMIFSAGLTNLEYTQSSFGTFVSQSLMLGASYVSPERGKKLGLMGSADLMVYTLSSSPVQANPQYLEMRLAPTYALKVFNSLKWRTRAFLGLSSVSLYPQGSPFGFTGLFAGDLGMRGEYFKGSDRSYFWEFHYMPYSASGFLSDMGLGLRGGWTRHMSNFRKFQVGGQYTLHSFKAGHESISSGVVSFWVGFSI